MIMLCHSYVHAKPIESRYLMICVCGHRVSTGCNYEWKIKSNVLSCLVAKFWYVHILCVHERRHCTDTLYAIYCSPWKNPDTEYAMRYHHLERMDPDHLNPYSEKEDCFLVGAVIMGKRIKLLLLNYLFEWLTCFLIDRSDHTTLCMKIK